MKIHFSVCRHHIAHAAQVLGTLLLLSVGLTALPAAAQTTSPAGALFQRKCALCHGQDGSGQTDIGKSMKAQDLRKPEVQRLTDHDLAAIIAAGKNQMPSYKSLLSQEQIDGLAKYVHTLGPPGMSTGDAALGPIAQAAAPLDGVMDLHVHCDPDSVPRSIDAIDLARLAKQRGMRGFVIKNHHEPTASLAYLVRKEVPGIEVFGGIVLNRSVGGINLAAVQNMVLVKGGLGKVVWMPTVDNENHVKYSGEHRESVAVSRNGELLPSVIAVLNFIAAHQLTLATGHSSPSDDLLLVHEAHKLGIKHIIVTHPMGAPVLMSLDQMQEAARDGAYLEFTYHDLAPGKLPTLTAADYVKAMRAVGINYCILSSDLGQPDSQLHPDGLVSFFAALRKEGLSQAEIDQMSITNPARALGL